MRGLGNSGIVALTNRLRGRGDVGLAEAQDGLERGALAGVELALVGAQPAALHEGLLSVGADLADRDLKVDVGLRRLDAVLFTAVTGFYGRLAML
jgi:hypothetical protein